MVVNISAWNNPCIMGVLTKFRLGKYAIMGDIDKMFLLVRNKEEDLDVLQALIQTFYASDNWILVPFVKIMQSFTLMQNT